MVTKRVGAYWSAHGRPESRLSSTPAERVPVSRADFRRFLFALTILLPIFRHLCKPRCSRHLPSLDYSFEVALRNFENFHSVPAESS